MANRNYESQSLNGIYRPHFEHCLISHTACNWRATEHAIGPICQVSPFPQAAWDANGTWWAGQAGPLAKVTHPFDSHADVYTLVLRWSFVRALIRRKMGLRPRKSWSIQDEGWVLVHPPITSGSIWLTETMKAKVSTESNVHISSIA